MSKVSAILLCSRVHYRMMPRVGVRTTLYPTATLGAALCAMYSNAGLMLIASAITPAPRGPVLKILGLMPIPVAAAQIYKLSIRPVRMLQGASSWHQTPKALLCSALSKPLACDHCTRLPKRNISSPVCTISVHLSACKSCIQRRGNAPRNEEHQALHHSSCRLRAPT